jgi:Protein of unknown function (DUF3800)
MECFRIDESGYTGFDLLNKEQRFQGASAVAISNDEASKLIREHFPNLRTSELKYRQLARRPSNHPRLLGLLRDLHSHHKCITYVADKRYLLTLMFVDYAVEPFYYERGIDINKDGGIYAAASLLYTIGPTYFGQDEFHELLVAFQLAVKEKSSLSKIRLLSAARNLDWFKLPEILGPLAKYASPECWDAIAMDEVNTDAAWIVLLSLISRTEVMTRMPYRIEHDQSKNLEKYHALIQRFIDHKDDVEFQATKITSMKFPLKLAEVTQVDSQNSPAVQLADVMMGAALDAVNNMTGLKNGGINPGELMSLYADDQIICMSPSTDFEEQKRFREGSQSSELIDYFAKNFSR